MAAKAPVGASRQYNQRYSRKVTVMLGDIDRIQLALGSADDYLRWLDLKGVRRGAIDSVIGLVSEARELAYLLRGLAESQSDRGACLERPRCPDCGNEIDPDCCGCGDSREDHNSMWSGHSFVPMGCDCMRERSQSDRGSDA